MYTHMMYFRNPAVSVLLALLIPVVMAAQPSGASDNAAPEEMPGYDPYELAENIRYPEFARDNGIEGEVILRALVGGDGRVAQIVIP